MVNGNGGSLAGAALTVGFLGITLATTIGVQQSLQRQLAPRRGGRGRILRTRTRGRRVFGRPSIALRRARII